MGAWKNAVATKEEQRETKRRMLLRVAGRIFNEKGFHNTSLDEIADELGVTKAALYYYVSGKDELLYECIKLTYECGRQARECAEEQGGTALEKLTLLYGKFMVLLMSEHGAYTTSGDVLALPQEWQSEVREKRRAFDRYSRKLIEQAVAEGSIRTVDPRLASNMILGAINWILRWHKESEQKTPEEIADVFLDLFTNGLLPRQADRAGAQ